MPRPSFPKTILSVLILTHKGDIIEYLPKGGSLYGMDVTGRISRQPSNEGGDSID